MAKLGRRQEYIRSSNIKAVMRALRNGGKTFAELEEIMGLSNAAIFKIISAMTETGMVVRTQLPSSTAGRRAEIITPNPSYGYFAVILAYGDILTVTVNNYVGEELYRKEYETGYVVKREILEQAIFDVKTFNKPLHHAVFVFAGKYDCKTDRFSFAGKFSEFYGENFAGFLEGKLGVPVCMTNDMSAAMYAELENPAVPDNFIFIYIDEGVGGGFVFNKKIFSGERGMAGEFAFFGMNPIDATDFFPNENSKIFSTVLSLKSITDRYLCAIGENDIPYAEIKEKFISDCIDGKEVALKTLNDSIAVLGRFLWSVTELLDVSHIIFDGEIIRLKTLVEKKLDEMFSKSPTHSQIDVKFVGKDNNIYKGAIAEGFIEFEKTSETK